MSNFGKYIKYWVPSIIWMMVIFVLSSRTRVHFSDDFNLNFLFFKSLHVIEYTMLCVLYFFALRFSTASNLRNDPQYKSKMFWQAAFLTMLYASSDEWHQDFVPTREGTPRDIIIDSFGILFAYLLLSKSLLNRIFLRLESLMK